MFCEFNEETYLLNYICRLIINDKCSLINGLSLIEYKINIYLCFYNCFY